MANLAFKPAENTTDKFYVDSNCIDCELCRLTAPKNFKRNQKSGFSFVFKQPQGVAENALCVQAKVECPVDAIGVDGDGDTPNKRT